MRVVMSVVLFFVVGLAGCVSLGVVKPSPVVPLVVADFNAGNSSNIGTAYGAWDKDPSDHTQGCKAIVSASDQGNALQLAYDVESDNPAYNGFWLKLGNLDAKKYSKVTFNYKGNPSDWKVELKNGKEVSAFYITQVNSQWYKMEIPLSSFTNLTDLTTLTEFVIVFEDSKVNPKTGTLFIDNIQFE